MKTQHDHDMEMIGRPLEVYITAKTPMNVTDQTLFGKHVASENTNSIPPAPRVEKTSAPAAHWSQRTSAGSARVTPAADQPATKAAGDGLEIVAFRIQQSLCLFDLDTGHFPTYSHKLKHLLRERGLDGLVNQSHRDKVLDILRQQATALNEALKAFPKK